MIGAVPAAFFSQAERKALLATPLVGPTVVQRLEQVGLGSFDRLKDQDPASVTACIGAALGSTCWANAPRARQSIGNAIATARAGASVDEDPYP